MLLCMQMCTVVTATLWCLAGVSWSADTTQKPLNPEENNNEGLSYMTCFTTRVANFTCETHPVTQLPQLCSRFVHTLTPQTPFRSDSRNRTESVFDLAPISLDSPPVRHSWDIMELWMLLQPPPPWHPNAPCVRQFPQSWLKWNGGASFSVMWKMWYFA